MTLVQPAESVLAATHFEAAREVLVAGISGAARENAALGRAMLATSGEGPYIIAPDGRRYLDYFSGFGSIILGYDHAGVRAAIEQALDMGIVHGPETVYQEQLARRLVDLVPAAEMVRFANSGSESTMAAIRLARAHTQRTKILKFEGHFHGMHEHVLYNTHPEPRAVTPGEIVATAADSAGMPRAFADAVIVVPWNDLRAVTHAFERHGPDIAAVIMEPINYNAGALLARLLAGGARAHARSGKPVDLRRGLVGIPHGYRLRAGLLRRHTRFGPAWEGRGERRAAGGHRGPARGDVVTRAVGPVGA